MVKNYYPLLFDKDPLFKSACETGKKIYEFSQFLSVENLISKIKGHFNGEVGFHNSCHSLRELGIDPEPIQILQQIKDIEIIQPPGDPVCCGFGGLFSVKFEEIASTMARTRLQMFCDLGIRTIISNDPGCIMHMRQEANDRKIDIQILHLTEFLVTAMGL